MPSLPTFTVTDAQAQRLLAAFGSVENYEEWLLRAIVGYVLSFEAEEINAQARDLIRAKENELRESLGWPPL
jgi:hypothetical protein